MTKLEGVEIERGIDKVRWERNGYRGRNRERILERRGREREGVGGVRGRLRRRQSWRGYQPYWVAAILRCSHIVRQPY